MQISDLLNRLSARERRDLARRRLGVDIGALSIQQLASALSDPIVVTQALAQLNAAQLRILTWLRRYPSLEAPWADFVEALHDRLPPAVRDEYVRELQAQALIDFDAAGDSGFIAMYPAVRAVLAPARYADVRAYFDGMNSDVLALVIAAMELSERPARKADRLAVIHAALTTPQSCQALLGRCSDEARSLFAWMLEQHGLVDTEAMSRRIPRSGLASRPYYGNVGHWWRPRPSPAELKNPLTELVRCGLVIPVSYYRSCYYGVQAYAVAEDVELASQGLGWFDMTPLQPPLLVSAEFSSGNVPDLSALLRDLSHLVGFVAAGRCEFKVDGEPYKRSLTAFGKLIGRADAAQTEFLWGLAIGAGCLRSGPDDGPPYVAAPIENLKPADLMLRIVNAWIMASANQSPAASIQATPFARQELLSFLCTVPGDTWITQSSADAWLRFRWPLAFGGRSGAAPANGGYWSTLGTFFLGRGVEADGNPIVMVPSEHQRLLLALRDQRQAAAFQSAVLPPWETSWTVQADRTIVAPPNASPAAIRDLWQVATLYENAGASLFRITAETVAGALNRGLTPSGVRTLLEAGSRTPLPPTVLRLIDDQGKRYGRIKVGRASTYITTDDATLLEELTREGKLKKLAMRVIAPGVAIVEAQDRDAVLAALRGAGHLPIADDEPPKPEALAKPALSIVPASTPRTPASASAKPLAPSAVRRLVREALGGGLSLSVSWREGAMVRISVVEPEDLDGHVLYAYDLDMDTHVEIDLDAVVAIEKGEPFVNDGIPPLSSLLGDEDL